jgi:hypothetical protein
MKRVLALAIALALAVPAFAEVRYTLVSATATSQTKGINAVNLVIKNDDGTNEIYVRVFFGSEIPAAATTANAMIKAGEALTISSPQVINAVSIVCDTAETATVRLTYY